MKHFYPAIFSPEEDGFSVAIPDMSGCFTEGDTLEQAYENAIDALGLYAQEQNSNKFIFPKASKPNELSLEDNEFVVLIEFDELAYLKKHQKKSVTKSVTLPLWLETLAEENDINFSQLLQTAIKDRLNLR